MKNDNRDLEAVIDRYSNMLYKICFLILKNEQDTTDTVYYVSVFLYQCPTH